MTEPRFGKQVLLTALLIASACSSGDTNSGARPATTPDAATDDGGHAAAGAGGAGGTSGQGGGGAGAGGAGSGAGAGGGGVGGGGAGGAGTGGTGGAGGSAPQSCTLDDDCDDDEPCTDGHCDDGVCSYTNNQAGCDDDDACTENDQCNGGQCSGEPLCNDACSDLNAASCMDIAITPVAAGGTHSCGRRESGAIRCWGSNANFALGYPPSSSTEDDVDIGGVALEIALGSTHSCALLEGGGVRCWGSALFSQLGYPGEGSITDEAGETPASVGDVALGGAAIDVDAGDRHTCVVRAGGDVLCWGDGERGKLGYGNTESVGDGETPASVGPIELGGSARQVVTGYNHSCALLTTGRVRCWGWGTSGVLGNAQGGTVGDNETPASQPELELGGDAVQLSAGRAHTCALLEDQSVRCWGLGSEGALGYGSTQNVGDDETPAARGAVDIGGPVTQISAGGDHTCALLADQSVRCWGRGTNGQLGYGNTDNIGDTETPGSLEDPVDVGGAVAFIDAGASHTCAALAGGSLRCWGDGFGNKLGYGDTEAVGDNESPASAGDIAW